MLLLKAYFPNFVAGGGGLIRRSNGLNTSVGSFLSSRALAQLGNKNWLLVFSAVISKMWKRKVLLPLMTLGRGASFHVRLPSAVHLWNYTAQHVLYECVHNFGSFFFSLNSKYFPKINGYLHILSIQFNPIQFNSIQTTLF